MATVTFEPVNATQVTIRPRIYKVDIGKVGYQGPAGPTGPQGVVSLADENVWTSIQHFPKDQFTTVQAKRDGDLVGGGSANGAADSAALTSYLAVLAALAPQRFVLEFEGDDLGYWLDPFTVPWNVHLAGRNQTALLVNRATVGGRFITAYKSNFSGLRIDHRRDSQLSGHPAGWAAVVWALPAAASGGAESLTGGLTLSVGPSAGATSIAVTSAAPGGVPIMPGDAINLRAGAGSATYEQVRVSSTYVPGSLTVALQSPLKNAYTTAAKVTLCTTNCYMEDCSVWGQVTWGGGTANHQIRDSALYDAPDTCVGPFEGGSVDTKLINLYIRTQGHWPIVFDLFNSSYLPHIEPQIINPDIAMLPGAADYTALGDTATVGGD